MIQRYKKTAGASISILGSVLLLTQQLYQYITFANSGSAIIYNVFLMIMVASIGLIFDGVQEVFKALLSSVLANVILSLAILCWDSTQWSFTYGDFDYFLLFEIENLRLVPDVTLLLAYLSPVLTTMIYLYMNGEKSNSQAGHYVIAVLLVKLVINLATIYGAGLNPFSV